MTYEIIDIPKEYTYINQIPEFKEDVPDNCYIDKVVCGSGFTTAILQNDVDYVIALPFKALGDNKVLQSKYDDSYRHELFMYHSGIENVDTKLIRYLQGNGVKKVLVTYDSILKLKRHLNFKNYKLFIDEGHKLLEYAGNFKPKVIHDLLGTLKDFRAFVICTATPTREEFIPTELKDIRKIQLRWSSCTPVNLGHVRLNQNQLKDSLLSLCLAHYRGDVEGNLYIFYNSVSGIVRLCKALKESYQLTPDDIKIICALNEKNTKAIRVIGKNWKPRPVIEEGDDKFYKINFITSTAFEGQDFLDPDGVTYIVSDGKLEHTKLDISTQVSQIAGRLRKSVYKDNINFLWTVSPTMEITSEEDYSRYLEHRLEEAEDYMNIYAGAIKNDLARKNLCEGVEKDPFFIDISESEKDYNLILNPNATKHLMNSFVGTKLQYYVNTDVKTTEVVVGFTLNEVFSGQLESTIDLPELSPKDKRKLGKKANFGAMVKQYAYARYQLANTRLYPISEEAKVELEDVIADFESDPAFETVLEYIEIFGFSEELKDFSEGYLRESNLTKKIEKYKERVLLTSVIKSKFSAGDVYTNKEAKEILEYIYKVHRLSGKPRLTDLELAFKTSETVLTVSGKRHKALRLS